MLSAPQRCNAERSDAQRNFFTSQVISPFSQRHRRDARPCFSASPVIIFHIAHIAFAPLLPFFLSPQWFTVQNNKKFTKSHNAAMLPLVGPAPLQKFVGDFCCINFGGFCRGFSWRIFLGTFQHKNEEKKSGDTIREKIRRPKKN